MKQFLFTKAYKLYFINLINMLWNSCSSANWLCTTFLSKIIRSTHLDLVTFDGVDVGFLPDDDLVGDGFLGSDPADDVSVTVLLDLSDHFHVTWHCNVLVGNTWGCLWKLYYHKVYLELFWLYIIYNFMIRCLRPYKIHLKFKN